MPTSNSPVGITRVILLGFALVALLIGIDYVVLKATNPSKVIGHHYYMALGNSLSFGYQPNLNFTSGFVDDVFTKLHAANVTDLVNYACAGETTTSMISGGCPGRIDHHGSYIGPQLQAAVDFLHAHPGQVSPITIELGSNDVLPLWNDTTCAVNSAATVEAALATMDTNLTATILPKLVRAVQTNTGVRPGDLHLLNYYNPFAKNCPDSASFVHELNDHLAADAAQFRIPVVDVYTAFGGDAGMAHNVCDLTPQAYTWICNTEFHDVHPTTTGYEVIAQAVELALGLPGTNPLPGIAPNLPIGPAPTLPPTTPDTTPTGIRDIPRWSM